MKSDAMPVRSGVILRRVFWALSLTLALGWPAISLAEWTIPGELHEKTNALEPDQLAFITSGEILEFIPERQLRHELSIRDADALSKLISDLMAVSDAMAFDAAEDMAAAPLNLTSRRFNRGALPTPEALRDFERTPGPFSVHRYVFPGSGVPTFAGAPVAIWPEDLTAGKVDVAILGVPSNFSSGRRDAGQAPDMMRAMNTMANPDQRTLIRPLDALSVVDYGNLRADYLSVERSIDHVTEMIAETANAGAIPAIVGGDTSMLYPGVKGVAVAHGKGSFGLLHLSAHPDVDRRHDHHVSDRRALFLLIEEGIVRGQDTIQIGMRGADLGVDNLTWLRARGVRYHTMTEIEQRGFDDVLKRVRREVDRGPDAFFVSIDVSALRPGEMPAAGRIAAGGLSADQATAAIRHVCAAKDIVGFEVTDLAPMLDVSRVSVLHANALVNACLNGIAARKAGLKPDYVHPLVRGHGQR